ncbi:GNAT family N-acetyltransferase [Photobacterium aquimaris]|uniref:N-acetyltransferase n=1 Tax=Photobacterium aquimaris TaxID=512643 RepID=A0A2T3HTQ5_9GAMM|nr:GNAT family N-acetyltransferase [Photobacterium aquimaris]OBU21994.1 acetyltransferase [Photobacterium aquimaris]PQJ40942.1 GNAT family N-acetyltransferase [Photobacterium aquimaris]PST98381.1 N-acetyltransferase [Photobacterium aquimaris]
MKIIECKISELDDISDLFDTYRQFYGQRENLVESQQFILERLNSADSVIFIAYSSEDKPLGFVQLYPSFSSVSMQRMWYLNDLFVNESARKQGVARSLLQRVKQFAIETGALTVKLATSVDNIEAKSLYISEGYDKVVAFEHYTQRVVQV